MYALGLVPKETFCFHSTFLNALKLALPKRATEQFPNRSKIPIKDFLGTPVPACPAPWLPLSHSSPSPSTFVPRINIQGSPPSNVNAILYLRTHPVVLIFFSLFFPHFVLFPVV